MNNIANKSRDISKGGKISDAFLSTFPEMKSKSFESFDSNLTFIQLSNSRIICNANIIKFDKKEKRKVLII